MHAGVVFHDRIDGGRWLAAALMAWRATQPVVVALARGGVPVGYEVARALGAPLDVLAVRKLAVPADPSLRVGALAEGGARYLDMKLIERLGLSIEQLREVIEEDRIQLYVQPVMRLIDAEPMPYEVLVRIEDSNGRLVSPGQFIEVAESLGLIQEIDLRVVQKLIHYLSTPERRQMRSRFFVNLSRVSISDPEWVRRFHALLESADISRGQLVFEISEAAAMAEVSISKNFIRELKLKGFRFALDNFGAGFSSFYYLRQFDVDYIKIDGSFVRDLTRDAANAIFVKALCDVGQGLSKQVIAKWVETPEVLSKLREMGVAYAQGNLFQAPYPIAAPETREPVFRRAVNE